jgi:Tfp pilus assembly protein PilV
MDFGPLPTESALRHPLSVTPLRGFSLIEVVIAIGLAAFVLVAIFGLFGIGLKQVGESEWKIDAANAAATVLGQRQIAPDVALSNAPLPTLVWSNLPATAATAISGEKNIDATGLETSGNARFKLRYRIWKDVSQSTNSHLVQIHLLLSWPPLAAISNGNQYDVLASTFVDP